MAKLEPVEIKVKVEEVPPEKPVWKSRTVRAGSLVTVIGVLGMLQCLPFVYNNPFLSSLVVTLAGVLMVLYRFLTGQPISPVFQMPNLDRHRPHDDPYDDETWDGWRNDPQERTRTWK